jgi:hypothetical protein
MLNCSAYVAWINAEDGQGYVVSYWIDGACSFPMAPWSAGAKQA